MKPENIIIHHSLTKDSGTVSWGPIRKYHMSYVYNGNIITEQQAQELINLGHTVKKPWKAIGYNFGIELIDDTYEILLGRMANESGAHTIGRNHDSIGICCVGNYDLIPPPEPLLLSLRTLCRFLMVQYGIPVENVYGHRTFASYKSCPGNLFDVEKFKQRLKVQI